MKQTLRHLLPLCATLLMTSCVADIEPYAKGWLVIAPPTKATTTGTRTGESGNIDYLVSVTHGTAPVFVELPYSTLNAPIPLTPGSYTLFAESCTKADADTGYGLPRYTGRTDFSITSGEPTTAKVHCTMANAAFQVVKDPTFYYESFAVNVTAPRRLTFTNEEQMGYFNVNEDGTETVLHYTVTATGPGNQTGTGEGIVKLKARTLSKLTLKAIAPGHINLVVTYDDTFTTTITQVVIEP